MAGPDDHRPLLRALDAGLNRAAEALRVVEDAARFAWNLEGSARDLKALRHDLFAAVAAVVRREDLIRARDVEGDVGREAGLAAVESEGALALRNLERAKEALRSLEEALRVVFPAAAPAIERLRYRLYAIERGMALLLPGAAREERLKDVKLLLIATSRLACRPLAAIVEEAARGGAGAVELREPGVPDRELLAAARALREVTARLGILLIVNDRPDIAALSHADGVHLGQDDLPLAAARTIAGKEALIGISTHSVEQARAAERAGADYIGIGPVFPTATKDAGPPIGLDVLAEVASAVAIPAFAIGGIDAEKASRVAAAGADRVAVSSAILTADRPGAAARAIREALERAEGARVRPRNAV
jgi:thiamine-phosphate pyrophosphorylase